MDFLIDFIEYLQTMIIFMHIWAYIAQTWIRKPKELGKIIYISNWIA